MSVESKKIAMMQEAERFWGSDIGKWIDNRMNEIISGAVYKLENADPFDGNAVALAQLELKNANALPGWISEIINEGFSVLYQQEDADDLE